MTRPRSQQVHDLQTRHSRFSFVPTPGSPSESISQASLFPYTVTDLPGGLEESVWAQVFSSTPDPYAIMAGDALSVGIDAAAPIIVTFAGTDTTASRVAKKINTALAGTFARSSEGIISVRSPTVGPTSKIVLADVVAGTLAKVGLTAGIFLGANAPVRGVVTRSLDGRGGTAALRTLDGRNLVTDQSWTIQVSEASAFPVLRTVDIPGGVPMHCRITALPASFAFRYFARMPLRAEIETFAARFDLLDPTDTFDVTVVDPESGTAIGPVTMTFPTGPGLTRSQVITQINDWWDDFNTGTNSGAAHVTGTVSQPYTFGYGLDSIQLSVNGAAFVTVTFLVTDVTAALAAARINGAVAGVTASAFALFGSTYLEIRSNDVDGTTSSLELRAPAGASDAFKTLGLIPGKYRGYYVCQPSEASEIKFTGIGRGSQANIVIASANPVSLTRMGLTAGTFSGQNEGDQPVKFPEMTIAGSGVEPIIALIPEVMDFGEVPISVESTLEQFGNRGSGSNLVQGLKLVFSDQPHSTGQGLRGTGRPVPVDPDGTIPLLALGLARREYENFFRKFIRGDFVRRNVTALVTAALETPGTNGNPGPASAQLDIDIDPVNSFADRFFQVRFARDVASFTPFRILNTSVPISGVACFVEARDNGGKLTTLSNMSGPLRVHDTNINSAGVAVAGLRVIPLTSAGVVQGDKTLRIMERLEGVKEPVSLFRQVNGRWTTTCGDGAVSFGDFNGSDAIQKAITFFSTYISAGALHLQVKAGSFTVNAVNGSITIPSDVKAVIEGVERSPSFDAPFSGTFSGTVIGVTDATVVLAEVLNRSTLTFKSVVLMRSAAPVSVIRSSLGRLFMYDCVLKNVQVNSQRSREHRLERCDFQNEAAAAPCVLIEMDGGSTLGPFKHLECVFRSATHNPVARIQAVVAAPSLSIITEVLFDKCVMNLDTTTNDGTGRLTGNCGVLDMAPLGTDAKFAGTGVRVNRVVYKDCIVSANVGFGGNSILIHLHPQGNGAAAGTEYLSIMSLIIDGGRWICPAVNTEFSPFAIADVGGEISEDDAPSPSAPGDVGLYVRNVRMGFSESVAGVAMGMPTVDMATDIFQPGGVPATAKWGAFAMQGDFIQIRDWELVGMTQNGGCGDVYFRWSMLDVDGMFIHRYMEGTPAGQPDQRVRLRPGDLGAGSIYWAKIRNAHMEGLGSPAASDWCSDGFYFLEPWGPPAVPPASTGPYVEFDGCVIRGFLKPDGTGSIGDGIFIPSVAAGAFYVASPNDVQNLTVQNCKIYDTFSLASMRSFEPSQNWHNVRFLDNVAERTRAAAIFFQPNAAWTEFVARGNRIWKCGKLFGPEPGLVVNNAPFAGAWTTSTVDIQDNYVAGNNALDTDTQIKVVVMAGPISSQPRGLVFGNNCKYLSSIGGIEVNLTDGAGAVATYSFVFGTFLLTARELRGIEVGYGDATGVFIVERWFVDSLQMFQNLAILKAP